MQDWLTNDAAGPAVLVTVAAAEGSVPRGPGTRMLVGARQLFDTIGGGHLELRATEIARAMLAEGRARHFERFPLGPGLGQCCGGIAYLAFELADADLLDALRARRGQDSWRVSALDGTPVWALFDEAGRALAASTATVSQPTGKLLAPSVQEAAPASASAAASAAPAAEPHPARSLAPAFARERGTHVMQDAAGRRWLVDAVRAPKNHLLLFGAGHVGAAVVRALEHLPCSVTWVDEREDMFPAGVPANVTVEASDTPEALVAAAPPGASYLVMTHSHALDQRLTEAIVARADVGWFGLIGSKTKRRQFEHRLHARGADPERIAAMVCPIGLPGIGDKAPAVIAASVCAQLLMVWEAAARAQAAAPPLRLVASRQH